VDSQLSSIEKIVRNAIKAGNDIHSIRHEYGPLFGVEILDLAIANEIARLKKNYDLVDPRVIARGERLVEKFRWYGGPHEHSERWIFAKDMLLKEGRSEGEIEEVEKSSAQILGLLSAPVLDDFSSRGLVLGYVQSGKTTNFIATIAQAADEGYRLIIVLSGVTNNLRRQTQERLEKSLTGENPKNWNWLTSIDEDFSASKNAADLLSAPGKRVIAVVKKNNSRLKRLKKWLESAPIAVRQGLPVLVIDDEADQATVNSHKLLNRQTAINKTLTSILKPDFLPKNAYLGYTATPFANILSNAKDPDQLFPRDFIYPLKRSDKYFGAEQIFGRDPLDETDFEVFVGRDILIPIPDFDRSSLGTLIDPKSNVVPKDIPQSLRDALMWFVLATAARRVRLGKDKFSTMLIHTSGRIQSHNDMKLIVEGHFRTFIAQDASVRNQQFSQFWENHKLTGWQDGDSKVLEWDEICEEVEKVLATLKIIVDNSKSEDRLVYNFDKEHESVPYIVIGGNTLARGLTLEGLISSYFMRTSSAYDSLLQMGRWFGYRVGYEDLQRIWMEADLIENFRDMALVEEEIRRQIDEIAAEGLDPSQVPIKIRDHKLLTITALNKMNYAKLVKIGYSKMRVETILLNTDNALLRENQKVTSRLIESIKNSGISVSEKNPNGWPIFKDVPWAIVKEFFEKYQWAQDATRAQGTMISKYVDDHQGTGDMEKWNIFVYQKKAAGIPILDLGNGISATAIDRSNIYSPEETSKYANIRALVTRIDRTADTGLSTTEVMSRLKSENKIFNDEELRKLRDSSPDSHGRGLLGIYVVNAKSKAPKKANGQKRRYPLDLDEHVVALGIFFGESKLQTANADYFGPDLFDTPDLIEDEYLDDADASDELSA
jgi:hypothetical protein